jgi:ABC-type lipoprotein export system ATPase subunit
MSDVIKLQSVSKFYTNGAEAVKALDNVSFSLKAGDSLAIVGSSGSGKTTLLNLLGGLDKPSEGKIIINGHDINALNDSKLSKFRNQTIGFVFQFFNLHDYMTARENVALPLLLAGKSRNSALKNADELLERMGLEKRRFHTPKQLSGGEMQRVAIARALANDPKMILADEPTGNLDKVNAERVLEIFDEIVRSGVSLIAITHDESVSKRFKQSIRLNKGVITN